MENYILKQCLAGALLTILVLISDKAVRADVNFKSKPTTVKTFENESVLLPCYSTERHSKVRWLNDDNELIADSQLPQYQIQYEKVLHPNGSLEVMNVQLNDTGNYICEVTVGYRVFRQVHSIEVQVAPEVIIHPSGVMNVTLGALFQITCEPKGVPYPIISWKHNNQIVTNTDDSNRRLMVEVKHYDMAGYIECIADNAVGEPASSGLLLLVVFAPEVFVEHPFVHSRMGQEAKLECTVFSHPTAQVHWFHNGKPVLRNHIVARDHDLTVTETLPSYYSKKRHVLIIRNIRDADFGRYECKAENSQGLTGGNITLSGNPLKPVFESKSQPATPSTKVLSWLTQSLSPIIDYKFRFRQVPTGNESFRRGKYLWNLLTIPADRDTTGPFHTKSYRLEGLNPSSVYEVIIQARNQYGHSDESNALRFSTPGLTDIISSSSTESNEYDSHFELDLQNEIYPAPYNAGSETQCSLTMATMSFTFLYFSFRVLLQFFYL